jgi:IclR family transcriptional regulator, acetate operon repressor
MTLRSKLRKNLPNLATATEQKSSSSSERSLQVLSVLSRTGQAMTLAEICAAINLPKATTHRICSVLLESGYLTKDADERSYVVGGALRTLAFDTLNHGTERGLRHAVLTDLVDIVGETCNLTTLDGAQVLYLDRVEAKWPWRLTLEVGSHVPIHCTASGKLLLAMISSEKREELLSHLKFEKLTNNSITSKQKLREECDRIAKNAYSLDKEEFVVGLIALAVPVMGADKMIRATIAVHAPSSRMSINKAIALLPDLRQAAERMSRLL